MTIVLIQIILALFFFINLYCEVSKRYVNCGVPVSLRWIFMVASLVALAKIKILAATPVIVQIAALLIVIGLAVFLYDHVLKRQIRITNFKLKKLYLSETRKRRQQR